MTSAQHIDPLLITVSVNATDAVRKMDRARGLLEKLPKSSANRVRREFFRLLDGDIVKVLPARRCAALDARNDIIRLRVVGVTELIAAAFRAANVELKFHRGTPVIAKVARTSKASTGRSVS